MTRARSPTGPARARSLIGLSKMAREPLAQATLCISAVELLSTDTPWTPAQFVLLVQLKEQPMYRLSCLAMLGLSQKDWKAFDNVDTLRSSIFHGSISSGEQHTELARKASEICDRIVSAAVTRAHPKGGVKSE